MSLPEGYEIREMSHEEFVPLWEKHASAIFDDNSQIFRVYDWLSEQEKEKTKVLRGFMGTPYQLRLGLFYKNDFVGWCAGHQESTETYYMRNSAVLPEHRKKGLYTALLIETMNVLEGKGFQKIYSRHSSTNNGVISGDNDFNDLEKRKCCHQLCLTPDYGVRRQSKQWR